MHRRPRLAVTGQSASGSLVAATLPASLAGQRSPNQLLPETPGYPSEPLNIKLNMSSGYRSGNLAELSSNGLHEGTARFEIGDPSLNIEQNICAEAGFTWEWKEQVEVGITGYRNQFFDYIHLAPTGEEYIGFQVYRFLQADAVLQGGRR